MIEVPTANHYALQATDFALALSSGGRPRLGRRDAVGQGRAIEALYAAAAGETWIVPGEVAPAGCQAAGIDAAGPQRPRSRSSTGRRPG